MGEEGFATDPNQIAQHLANHWAKTFTHKPINKHLLQEWLTSLPQLTPQRRQPSNTAPTAHNETTTTTNTHDQAHTRQHNQQGEPPQPKRPRHNEHNTKETHPTRNRDRFDRHNQSTS